MSKREHDVLEPLRHDGTRYEPGAVVELTAKQAKPLEAAKPPVVRARGAGEQSGGGSDEPKDPVQRHAALLEFMATLEAPEDPKGSNFWTNAGKPDTYALADALGWSSVSAKERDAAWQEATAGGGAS